MNFKPFFVPIPASRLPTTSRLFNTKLLHCFICLIFFSSLSAQRLVQNFDKDWRFLQRDTAGAEQTAFNDAKWRQLDLPHDWSIEGSYDKNNKTGRGGGYLPAGIGWYRKSFDVPTAFQNKKIFIEFDGVMANSDVWINGHHAGKRPFGYVSFIYDLTPHIKPGKNVIAVKADNTLQPASRWYSGAGIYRHTRLIVTNQLHIDQWGVFITTPKVSETSATVSVQINLLNSLKTQQQITLETSIIDANGKQLGISKSNQTIAAAGTSTAQHQVILNNPVLWNVNQPKLYFAVTKVLVGNKISDEQVTTFGIRQFHFDAATGFHLNGKNIKLKGVCLHHDGGGVGAAVPLRIWEKRLETLKQLGVNAIRTAHNPMASEFLDLCDRMGFLVMNETFDTWAARKSNADKGYNLFFNEWWERDTRDIVLRDRNHPSIIIYSVGNEIRDNLNDSSGFKKYRDQQNLIHQLDGTRPVTMALFRPGESKVYTNGFVEIMDVIGQNYRENELVAVHNAKPQLKVIGTENAHSREAWLVMRNNPFIAGHFLWTGIDYLGEEDWPSVASGAGLLDKTGTPKPRGFERQSWWSEKPMIYIARRISNAGEGQFVSDWTPSDPDTYDEARIEIYSNCEEVELFLNDQSLGKKNHPADDAALTWNFAYKAGTLKAIGKNKNVIVATHELVTAGPPAKIKLTADKSSVKNDWDDVVFVTAIVVDANGRKCPNAHHMISFTMNGPGIIAAVDSGNRMSHESYKSHQRQAYQGECIAIIKASGSKGKINITATAEGLEQNGITLDATK